MITIITREREIEKLKEKERNLERKRLELREKELDRAKDRERRKAEVSQPEVILK